MEQILALYTTVLSLLASPNAIGIYKILGITTVMLALIPLAYYIDKFINPQEKIAANAAAAEQSIEDLAEKKLMAQGIVPSWRKAV